MMDTNEVALQITLKAMELKLIPYTRAQTSDDTPNVIKANSDFITDFFNAVKQKL